MTSLRPSTAKRTHRGFRYGATLSGVIAVLIALLFGGGAGAQAATARPVITNYSAVPAALPWTGGPVTLAASVTGAAHCTFSGPQQGISGLPVTVPCDSGTASTIVTVSANAAGKAKRLRVKLTALGQTNQSSGSTIITIAQAPPKPTIVAFAGNPPLVPSAGGSVTLSATVTDAPQCTFSSTSGATVVSGLPATVACDSGTATTIVTVPANTSATAKKYAVELSAAGPTKSAVARAVITVAPAPPPTITIYTASPSPLSWTGGTVTLTAAVTNATTCTFSARGKANAVVSGLPVTRPCTSGTASVDVNVGANHGKRARTYTVALTATGAGTKVTTTTDITVSPITTPPTISSFVSSPSPLPSTGGAATLTVTVANAVSCTFSSKKAAVSGLPVTVPCSSGTASTTVIVTANAGHRTHSYLVEVTVKGQRKKVSATTLVTVAGSGRR